MRADIRAEGQGVDESLVKEADGAVRLNLGGAHAEAITAAEEKEEKGGERCSLLPEVHLPSSAQCASNFQPSMHLCRLTEVAWPGANNARDLLQPVISTFSTIAGDCTLITFTTLHLYYTNKQLARAHIVVILQNTSTQH